MFAVCSISISSGVRGEGRSHVVEGCEKDEGEQLHLHLPPSSEVAAQMRQPILYP
jgi:hypothetical protein